MKKIQLLQAFFLMFAFLLSACEEEKIPTESQEISESLVVLQEPTINPSLLPNELASEVNNMEDLVPQAIMVQELLKGKNIMDGVEEIPFENVSEIIPEPNYSKLGRRLYLQTKKIMKFGDGGDLPELFNGFHYIDGDYERDPYYIKQFIHAAVYNNNFPFYSNLFKISFSSVRFIFDGANSGYYYMFDGYTFDYWTEKSNWQYDDAGIFPEDLSFCILFGEPTYLVNHTLGKKVVLPNLHPSDLNDFFYYGKHFAITRDHKYLIYVLNSGEFIKYSLLDGTSTVIFADKPVEENDSYFILLDWKSNNELYYQRNTSQYSLNIDTKKSTYVGEYMYYITQSPDGKYMAYTHPDLQDIMGSLSDEEYLEYGKLFNEEDYGTIVQDTKTGKIVKFIPGEYLVGWFYE